MAILGGGSNPGTLQSSSGSGVSLSKTQAPVTYVAPATIEGDSLVVQVAASEYNPVAGGGSVGSAETSTLAKGSSLQTKAPRRALARSAGLDSDRAVLERIGKLLANNQCQSGKAVVKQKIALPWCDELPQPLTHFTSTRRDNGPGCDASDPGKPSYSEPDYAGLRLIVRICYDQTLKAARIDPYLVGGQILYGICESSIVLSQKVLIRNGETVSEETSRFLRAELEYRLQAINAGAGPWYQRWLTEAELITHEERHLPQFELLLASAAANIKSKYTEVLMSAEEAVQIASSDRRKKELDDRIRGDFLLEFANLERQTHDDDEKDAALMQAETIKILMKQYGTNSQ